MSYNFTKRGIYFLFSFACMERWAPQRVSAAPGLTLLSCRPGCGSRLSVTQQNKFFFPWTVIKAVWACSACAEVFATEIFNQRLLQSERQPLQLPAKWTQSLAGSEFTGLRVLVGKHYSNARLTCSTYSYDFSQGSGVLQSRGHTFPGSVMGRLRSRVKRRSVSLIMCCWVSGRMPPPPSVHSGVW